MLDYKGHRERLRERFLKDLGVTMGEYELLELALMYAIERKDVKPLSKKLIKRFKTIQGVLSAELDELKDIDGIGDKTIVFIKLLHRISSISAKTKVMKGHILSTWDSLVDYCTIEMAHKNVEQFRVLYLNNKNYLIADEEQTRGTVNETSIYSREVIKRALVLNSTAIILVHNHPSGDPTPSVADKNMTLEIKRAADLLNIKLHDHIIIGKEAFISFKVLGLL